LKGGTTYELGGPEVATFRECMEEMLKVIGRKRLFVSIPWSIARIQGAVFGLLPNPVLTTDQVESLRTDNIVSDKAKADGRTLDGIGIMPASMEAILPSYLWRFREYGQYYRDERNGVT
jgi:NADH dehydrogenase